MLLTNLLKNFKIDNTRTVIVLTVLIFSLVSFFFSKDYLNLDYIKENYNYIHRLYYLDKLSFIFIYATLYIVVSALSIPGATILTLVASMIMGFSQSLIVVTFSATLGAIFSFLLSRYLFQSYFQKKYQTSFTKINKKIKESGNLYLFALRLIPIFPFFLVNLVIGMTQIKLLHYSVITMIGILPGTIIYINAGSQLAKLDSISEVFNFNTIFSFALIGIFPLLIKRIFFFKLFSSRS